MTNDNHNTHTQYREHQTSYFNKIPHPRSKHFPTTYPAASSYLCSRLSTHTCTRITLYTPPWLPLCAAARAALRLQTAAAETDSTPCTHEFSAPEACSSPYTYFFCGCKWRRIRVRASLAIFAAPRPSGVSFVVLFFSARFLLFRDDDSLWGFFSCDTAADELLEGRALSAGADRVISFLGCWADWWWEGLGWAWLFLMQEMHIDVYYFLGHAIIILTENPNINLKWVTKTWIVSIN